MVLKDLYQVINAPGYFETLESFRDHALEGDYEEGTKLLNGDGCLEEDAVSHLLLTLAVSTDSEPLEEASDNLTLLDGVIYAARHLDGNNSFPLCAALDFKSERIRDISEEYRSTLGALVTESSQNNSEDMQVSFLGFKVKGLRRLFGHLLSAGEIDEGLIRFQETLRALEEASDYFSPGRVSLTYTMALSDLRDTMRTHRSNLDVSQRLAEAYSSGMNSFFAVCRNDQGTVPLDTESGSELLQGNLACGLVYCELLGLLDEPEQTYIDRAVQGINFAHLLGTQMGEDPFEFALDMAEAVYQVNSSMGLACFENARQIPLQGLDVGSPVYEGTRVSANGTVDDRLLELGAVTTNSSPSYGMFGLGGSSPIDC